MTFTNAVYNGTAVTQDTFGAMLKSFTSDGYVKDYGDELEVTVTDPVAMKVQVLSGRAHIQGYWYENDETPYELTISPNTEASTRYDRVILRLETGAPRQIAPRILEGVAGSGVPALTQTSAIYEIALATITIATGVSTITSSAIADTRSDVTVCGQGGMKGWKFSEVTIGSDVDLEGYKITNIGTPSAATSATNLTYFNTKLSSGKFGINACTIIPWTATTVPAGWLECNGQLVSGVTYPTLYAAWGTTYGGSDGSFNLPNLQGRVPLGAASSLGTTGGEAEHTLTEAEMPAHTHPKGESVVTFLTGTSPISACAIVATNGNTGSTGGGAGHNNLQEYIVMKYIVYGS